MNRADPRTFPLNLGTNRRARRAQLDLNVIDDVLDGVPTGAAVGAGAAPLAHRVH